MQLPKCMRQFKNQCKPRFTSKVSFVSQKLPEQSEFVFYCEFYSQLARLQQQHKQQKIVVTLDKYCIYDVDVLLNAVSYLNAKVVNNIELETNSFDNCSYQSVYSELTHIEPVYISEVQQSESLSDPRHIIEFLIANFESLLYRSFWKQCYEAKSRYSNFFWIMCGLNNQQTTQINTDSDLFKCMRDYFVYYIKKMISQSFETVVGYSDPMIMVAIEQIKNMCKYNIKQIPYQQIYNQFEILAKQVNSNNVNNVVRFIQKLTLSNVSFDLVLTKDNIERATNF